jgi:hypothetical protein
MEMTHWKCAHWIILPKLNRADLRKGGLIRLFPAQMYNCCTSIDRKCTSVPDANTIRKIIGLYVFYGRAASYWHAAHN